MRTGRHFLLLTILVLALLSVAGCGSPLTPTAPPLAGAPSATVMPASVTPNTVPPLVSTPSAAPTRGTSTPAGATATRATAPRATAATVGASPVAGDGARLVLRLGQSGDMATTGLTLRFSAVTEDSRCPRSTGGVNVACAWAGQAIVFVEAKRGTEKNSLRLTISGLTDDTTQQPASAAAVATFAGYRIQIVSLEPQPNTTDGKPDQSAYVVTLLVTAVP